MRVRLLTSLLFGLGILGCSSGGDDNPASGDNPGGGQGNVTCQSGFSSCEASCVDTQASRSDCGACGKSCGVG